jgi:hypothetical protein
MKSVRVESQKRIVGEEQWAAGSDADVEFDAVIGVAVGIVIAVAAAGSSLAVILGEFRLA